MEAVSTTIYTVRTEIEALYEDEFNEWQSEEHLPWLLDLPGYMSVRRFVEMERPRHFMNLWEIRSMEDYDSPSHSLVSNSPWGRRMRRYRKLQVDFYQQAFPDKGFNKGPAWGESLACLVIDRFNPVPSDEPALIKWCDTVYLPEINNLLGVIGTRRFTLLRGSSKHVVMYYLSKPVTGMGTEWEKAVNQLFRQTWKIPERVAYRPISSILTPGEHSKPHPFKQ